MGKYRPEKSLYLDTFHAVNTEYTNNDNNILRKTLYDNQNKYKYNNDNKSNNSTNNSTNNDDSNSDDSINDSNNDINNDNDN